MSEKMTTISVPGSGFGGLGEWGEQDAATMIERLRTYGKRLRDEADLIDATPDADFRIVCARGVHVRRDPKVIQEGHAA